MEYVLVGREGQKLSRLFFRSVESCYSLALCLEVIIQISPLEKGVRGIFKLATTVYLSNQENPESLPGHCAF